MTRLFVGLRPPAPVRDVLLGAMGGVDRARWQDEDQLHLTLRFVGEIDAPLANDLAAALGQVDAAPFDLRIAGVGHFERKGRATTLWAGLAASPQLLAFQQKIERDFGNPVIGGAVIFQMNGARFFGAHAISFGGETEWI